MVDAGVGATIEALDFVRYGPRPRGEPASFKEWQHFAILTDACELLVNFSVCDDPRPGAPGEALPRLIIVARDAGGWDGDVEEFREDETYVGRGRTDLDFAGNTLVFRDGRFFVSAALRDRPIAVHLRLDPVTMPAYAPSVPMLDGPPLHWSVVPRLEVHGVVEIAGRRHRLERALAYHDHNWGRFLWGHDVAWEWGFVLPDDPDVPWTTTFVRLTNRARTVALSHGMLLWHGERMARVFRGRELSVETPLAYARRPRPFKVPRPMALVAPELAIDVPTGLVTEAASDPDRLRCACTVEDVAQVLIPSETGLGVTIFNEATARAHVRGVVDGTRVDFTGRAVMEFIRVV
jgi:hypothetical protein